MPFDIEDARARLAGLERFRPGDLRRRIEALARPRMTGSEGADAVEQELRSEFEELGYEVQELPFSFSNWPGRLGICVAGGAVGLAGAVGGGLLAADRPVVALIVLVLGMAVAMATFLALDTALHKLPRGRTEGRNLLFTRPGSRPAWIIMAHRDSKSQFVPTLVRTGAITVGAVVWVALVAMTVVWWGGEPFRSTGLAILGGALLFAAGLALALSWASNESPGALDNASGLAAVQSVAAAARDNGDIGFLITDAEELGLVGARLVVPLLPPVQGIINVDGLDDYGSFIVAEGYGWRRSGSAPQLAAALLTAATALDYPVERRPLPRSVLVDHMPVAAAGIPALTLLRGGWASLLRVHTPRDSADRLDGTGAATGATLLYAAVRLLADDEGSHLAGGRATSP